MPKLRLLNHLQQNTLGNTSDVTVAYKTPNVLIVLRELLLFECSEDDGGSRGRQHKGVNKLLKFQISNAGSRISFICRIIKGERA